MKKSMLSIFIVSISLIFVLLMSTFVITNSKFIYNLSIEKFDLEDRGGISKAEIITNYSYVVDYIAGFDREDTFVLPTLDYSQDGAVHFYEVKKLFDLLKISLLLMLLILFFAGGIYYINFKSFAPFKMAGITMMTLPLGIGLIVSTNFNFFFTVFHKIFFNNDKWLFDPVTDPIINILPEEFFALCAGLIVLLTMIIGGVMFIVCKKFLSDESKKSYKTMEISS